MSEPKKLESEAVRLAARRSLSGMKHCTACGCDPGTYCKSDHHNDQCEVCADEKREAWLEAQEAAVVHYSGVAQAWIYAGYPECAAWNARAAAHYAFRVEPSLMPREDRPHSVRTR